MEGVPSALAAARDGIDALLCERGLRRRTPELTAESLLRGAVASAALDGSSATADDVASGRADEVASGAARLNSQLLSLVPVIAQSPLQALARMHSLVAPPGTPPDQVGRPRRNSSVTVGLQVLARQLLASTETPSLAVASLAHAELLTLAPFHFGSGLVARALERLLLVARGVDPTSLTVPEVGHLAAGPAYDEALRAYAVSSPEGTRWWLLYAADAFTVGASLSPAGP